MIILWIVLPLLIIHLTRLQLKIILEKLWQEFPDPVIELVVLGLDHLDHEVHLLQTRREEVRAAGFIVKWTGSSSLCNTMTDL